MTDGEGKIITVHLDRESVLKLERLAVAEDRSRSWIIRHLLHVAPEPATSYQDAAAQADEV
jgi:predicted transcriptional regulator